MPFQRAYVCHSDRGAESNSYQQSEYLFMFTYKISMNSLLLVFGVTDNYLLNTLVAGIP